MQNICHKYIYAFKETNDEAIITSSQLCKPMKLMQAKDKIALEEA